MTSRIESPESEAVTPTRLSITWLGHATVLIEMDGVRLLTDPVLRHRIGPLVRVVPDPAPVGPADLGECQGDRQKD